MSRRAPRQENNATNERENLGRSSGLVGGLTGDPFPLVKVTDVASEPHVPLAILAKDGEAIRWWERPESESRVVATQKEAIDLLSRQFVPIIRQRIQFNNETGPLLKVQFHRAIFDWFSNDDLLGISMMLAMLGTEWEEVSDWR